MHLAISREAWSALAGSLNIPDAKSGPMSKHINERGEGCQLLYCVAAQARAPTGLGLYQHVAACKESAKVMRLSQWSERRPCMAPN